MLRLGELITPTRRWYISIREFGGILWQPQALDCDIQAGSLPAKFLHRDRPDLLIVVTFIVAGCIVNETFAMEMTRARIRGLVFDCLELWGQGPNAARINSCFLADEIKPVEDRPSRAMTFPSYRRHTQSVHAIETENGGRAGQLH